MKTVITASVDMDLAEELKRTGKPSYHVNLALRRYFSHLERKKRKRERQQMTNNPVTEEGDDVSDQA